MKYIFNPLLAKFEAVEDDHTKLLNIGNFTHAQIDTFIETTVPTTYLPLAGGIMTGNILMTGNKLIGGSTTTSNLYLQTTSGVGTTGADMHFLVGNNGATEAMTILNSGRVGIGTTSPSARLEVAPLPSGIALKVGRVSGKPSIRSISDTDWLIADAGTGGRLGLNFWSTGDVVLVNGGGKVGIGIIAPGSKLQVNGNAVIGYSESTAGPANGLAISGKVGIGTAAPTAVLHLKAGTATANTAPLKLTPGTLNTTPEEGAIEFDGIYLYFVDSSGTRKQLAVV